MATGGHRPRDLFRLAWRLVTRRIQPGRDVELIEAEHVEVEVAGRAPLVAFDGEKRRMRAPITFAIRPDALTIVVPEDRAAAESPRGEAEAQGAAGPTARLREGDPPEAAPAARAAAAPATRPAMASRSGGREAGVMTGGAGLLGFQDTPPAGQGRAVGGGRDGNMADHDRGAELPTGGADIPDRRATGPVARQRRTGSGLPGAGGGPVGVAPAVPHPPA